MARGLYAIYYSGEFHPYRHVATTQPPAEDSNPIYVGKAIPMGGRKGGFAFDAGTGHALYNRLKDHLESVRAAGNLGSHDFSYRALVVDDIWIPLGENLLINRYQPIWNAKIDGFGNHDPGQGRAAQKKSPWDELHPGRKWAEKLAPAILSAEEIVILLEAGRAVPEVAPYEPPVKED